MIGPIEKYLNSQPKMNRVALQKLRSTILSLVPNAEEAMIYGVPGVKVYGKSLVCYAGFKKHCGFYPMNPEVIRRFESDLKGFETAKGTIRFHPEHPLPDELIQKMLEARLSEISG